MNNAFLPEMITQELIQEGVENQNPKPQVLLVDADQKVLQSYARILKDQSYTVTATPNSENVTALLHSGSYEVVLSDIFMPKMDGFDLLNAVHQYDPDIPVIFMTEGARLSTAIKALEHGVFHYLRKPIDSCTLKGTINGAMRAYQVARSKRRIFELINSEEGWPENVLSYEAHFSRALRSLWMAYQPIISWKDQSVFGYEALLRSKEKTFEHPLRLFEAAERLQRVHDVGRLVRNQVAQAASDLPSHIQLFNNIHPLDLNDDEFFKANSPLVKVAKNVVIEITEFAAIKTIEGFQEKVAALRELGFKLAIDDLGSGYNGLQMLDQLEPDIVKIDMALVRNIHLQSKKQRIVRAIIDLCDDLGISVIAEGVETECERDALISLGCNFFQGFLFAAPAPTFTRPRL